MSEQTWPGLEPGEDPYKIKNDDPRVAETVAVLQSWGAPQQVKYVNLADVGAATNECTVFIGGGEKANYAPISGLMVKNPPTCYDELKMLGLINKGTATAPPPPGRT